ncbi:MAG: flippase, partial [Patescibacteria group bacterium]
MSLLGKLKAVLLENRTTRQTVFKNALWLSFGQIFGRLIRAAIIVYAARVLGAADYGVFSYALGLAGFFTIFADIGINGILTRDASQKPAERSYYFATSFWLKSILLFLTAAAIVFIAPYFSKIEAAKALIPFVALLTIFDGIREFSNSFLRALEKMELEAFVNTAMNIVITAAGFTILAVSATTYSLTLSYALSAGVGALLAVVLLRKEYAGIMSNFRRALLSPIIRDALPIALLSLFGAFMLNVDMIMLGWWRAPEELGFYSAAQKIVQVLYTLPGILAAALFPVLARLIGAGEHGSVRVITERAMTALFLIALPLTLGGIVLAKSIMAFLYGAEYLPAASAFRFLIATTLIIFPAALLGNLVVAFNKQKKVAWCVALGAAGNIALSALLIPPFGIVGAATAIITAQFITHGFIWRIMKKTNDFRTFAYLGKIFLASLVMGGCAFVLDALGVHVLVSIALSALVYFG